MSLKGEGGGRVGILVTKFDRGNCDRKVQSPFGGFKVWSQGLSQVKKLLG